MKSKKQTPLEQIFLRGEKITFKKHQIIFSSDQIQKHVYFIQKGHVATYSGLTQKNTRLLSILKPRDFFPILKILIQHEKPSRFIALDEVRIFAIPIEEFQKLSQDPQHAPDILQTVASLLSIFIDRVDNLEIARADARLISRLLFFAKNYGTPKEGGLFINIPMTHAIIASSIAATRETVTRELIKLERKGIIEYENQKITINSLKKLEAELKQSLS